MNAANAQQLYGWLAEQINTRPARERLLMLGALLALSFGLANGLYLSPALSRLARATQAEQDMSQALIDARQAVQLREQQARASAARFSAELAAWRERVQQAESQLAEHGKRLLPASAMPDMLDALLRQHPGMSLKSLRTLPTTELPGTAGPAPVYRQGVQLVLEGSYADLLAYCRTLEALPQGLLWGDMQLAVEAYPRVTLTLDVYTLSQDKPWLKL